MHIGVDGHAARTKPTKEKRSQAGIHASEVTKLANESRKRAREPDDDGNEPGSPQPRPAKRVAVESGSRWQYAQSAKESQAGPSVTQPKQSTGSQSKTPQEKTADDRKQDLILQAGSYAVEMLSMTCVHVWNFLIVDERVHIWYYDRQGGIQSYGLSITDNLPHFFVLLLALQRLSLEGWGFAPGLSFDKDDAHSAQIKVKLHTSGGDVDVPCQEPVASIKLTHEKVLRKYWGFVGRTTTVYECDLTGCPLGEQVVKLSWPEVTRIPEPEILKRLKTVLDEAVQGHIPILLASHVPAMMNTQLIQTRLDAKLQPHYPEARGPRWFVVTVCKKLRPVWGLTPHEFFEVWLQCFLCHIILWKGYYHRDVSPPNIMYCRDGDSVVGVLNNWDLAAALSVSPTPNTDRTGTVSFMALELLSNEDTAHMFWHDTESFIWVFLWVCASSDGSEMEAVVEPYKTWRGLDMLACKQTQRAFLSAVRLEDINVSEHHAPNHLFCLFLAWLLGDLRRCVWHAVPTSEGCVAKDQEDTKQFERLLTKFREVHSKLSEASSLEAWDDRGGHRGVKRYIYKEVVDIALEMS